MTLSYGFYNSVSSDRVYDAKDFGQIFDGIILDGVYAALGDYFMVSENGTPDMNVLVGTGRAWFNNTWSYNDANIVVAVSTADALLPRIDVVYLEVNEDTGVRANSIDILDGTPASSPVAPTLTNTTTVHQYPLAHIYVGAGVTVITQANITNKVGTAETPFVTCPLEYVETNDLLAEWETQWLEWFDAIKDQLSTEAETNLQAQIWDLAGVASGAPPYADDMVSLASHDHSGAHPQIPAGGIATGAVTESKIGTGAVTNTKLASNAVTQVKMADGSVGTAELINDSVTNSKIGPGAVGTTELASGAVTNVKMAANSVDTTQLVNESVTAAKIDNRTRIYHITGNMLINRHAYEFGTSYWEYMGSTPYWGIVPLLDSEGNNSLEGVFPIPDDWVSGTNITVKLLWGGNGISSATWRAKMAYRTVYDSFDYDTAGPTRTFELTLTPSYGSEIVKLDTLGTILAADIINGPGDVLPFYLDRNRAHGDDTGNDIGVIDLQFIYTADS